MAYLSHVDAYQDFRNKVLGGIKSYFPVVGKLQSLHLDDLEVQEGDLHADDIRAQHQAKLEGRTWAAPVLAKLTLKDNATGRVVDSKKMRIAEIPLATSRYSHIVDGQEYQVTNQWQLKPGIYARRRQTGELEAHFNIPNKSSFDVTFNPATKQFRMARGGSEAIPFYPIIKSMGVDDDSLEHSWGKEILEANKHARGVSTGVEHFFRADRKKPPASREEAEKYLHQTLSESRVRPEAVQLTLGKPFENVTGEALHLASTKLLKIQAGHPEDDRDSLVFKDLRTTGDFAYDKLTNWKTVNTVKAKFSRKINLAKNIRDVVKFDTFNEPVRQTFIKNTAAAIPDQVNPVEMITSARQTTIMGPGGIQGEHSISDEAKFINPSHLGFLDPLHTPENEKTGVTLHLPIGVQKVGNEPRIPLYNLKLGKVEHVGPSQFIQSRVVLPDQLTWKSGKPTPIGPTVKMSGVGNQLVDGKFSDAHYAMIHPSQLFDVTSNLIPFLGTTSGNRATYATHHIQQAISLLHREAPLVQSATGSDKAGLRTFEEFLGRHSAHVSPTDGTVSAVRKDAIIVHGEDGKKHEVQLYHNFPLNDPKSFLHSTPSVKVGDKVTKGQGVADTNFTKGGILALGTNLRVAYLPFKGYNFEDGVVLSESAAKKLSSVHMHKPSITLDEKTVTAPRKFSMEHPEAFQKEQYKKLDENGIVRVGEKVETGDPLIIATRPYQIRDRMGIAAIRRSLSGQHTDVSLRWDSDHPGEVVGVHKIGNDTVVHVKTIEPMHVGDKLSGRYGNKGIITMVLPDKSMPHTADGRHIEVALNPSGVPGRMNVGQVLETAVAKIAEKTGKTYIVKNFEQADQLAKVKEDLKQHGISDMEELHDPETGVSLGKALVGPQYILKLMHQVDKKISSRAGMGLPGSGHEPEHYDLNLMPSSGAKTGAQSMGHLGFYTLLAHGAKANIREMQTLKSEGIDPQTNPAKRWESQHLDVWNAIQTGAPLPTPRPTFAFHKFTEMLKAAGINIEKKGHELHLSPLTDKQILKLSSGELPKPTDLTYAKADENGEPKPKPGGLFDPKLTGGHGGKKWTHVTLAEPVPNPVFEDAIQKVLGLSREDYRNIVNGEKSVDTKGQLVALGSTGSATGGLGVKRLLDKIDVKKDLSSTRKELEDLSIPKGFAFGASTQKIDKLTKKLKYLQALNRLDIHPTDAYILHHIPILPPALRPASVLPDGTIRWADLNGLYSQFAQVNGQLKDPLISKNLTDEAKKALRRDLYDGVKAISGYGTPYAQTEQKGVLLQIAGASPKKGYFQKTLMNRRQDLTMRSVIVPEPALGLDEVGLPAEKAKTLFRPFLVKKLQDIGAASGPLEAQELLKKDSPVVNRALAMVAEEQPVLLKRDPALHKHSVLAFKPKLVSGRAIQIHPLVTSGFNADFDGDCVLGDLTVVLGPGSLVGMPHVNCPMYQTTIIDISRFPRVETSSVTKSSGVTEYDVPNDVYVPAYQEGRIEMKPVSKFSVHPNCEEWKVVSRNGREIICSSDHSLALLNPETLEVEKAPPRNSLNRCFPVLRSLAEPKLHDTLPGTTPLAARAIRMVANVALTFDTGWFIGASTGDGWVTNKTGDSGWTGKHKSESTSQSRGVCLAYGDDGVEVRDEWAKIGTVLANASGAGDVHQPHEYNGYQCSSHRCTISSTALGLWLEELIGHGAAGKHLPPKFLEYPTEFRQGLFCGLVDTDGTVHWNKGKAKSQFALAFSTISKSLADDIQLLGLSVGLPASRTTYEHNDKPAYIITFSSRPIQDARWIRLRHKDKKIALEAFWSSGTIEFGRNDFVPMPSRAREELLGHLRDLGAAIRPPKRNSRAFSQYVVLQRADATVTRVSAQRLFELLQNRECSPYLSRWFDIALDPTVGWDSIESATATGEVKTMYDITVPDAWTFTMANGAVVWDTMSIYAPISREAVAEARKMFPSNNLFNEATGHVMYQPTLESALGLYKLSLIGKPTSHKFPTPVDALKAAQTGKVHVNDLVEVGGVKTTPGRILIASALPKPLQDEILTKHTQLIDKHGLTDLFSRLAKDHKDEFPEAANKLKDLGNGASFGAIAIPHPDRKGPDAIKAAENAKTDIQYITLPTHSLGLKDFEPDRETRDPILNHAQRQVDDIYKNTLVPKEDKERRAVDIWTQAASKIQQVHQKKSNKDPSNLYMMQQAGVKPSWDQYKQMVLAPILVSDASGKVVPTPIKKSYAEGLDVGSYWTQMHGARHGNVLKVQEVQEPGFFSKKLINTAMNMVVADHDCGTHNGIALPVGSPDVYDRSLAREFSAKGVTFKAGTLLTPDVVTQIRALGKDAQLLVRSPLKCEHPKGICQADAGLSADGKPYPLGTNLGILAAQALGERSVQLSLKAFHTGGVVTAGSSKVLKGFARIDQLTKMPEKIADSSILAMRSGNVDKIEHDPTGVKIWINGQAHHVGKDRQGMPLHEHLPDAHRQEGFVPWTPPVVGAHVEAGASLSDPNRTAVNPHHLYQATGSMEKVQNYLVNELHDAYSREGVRRQHVETLIKAMSNLTRIRDSGDADGIIKGEFQPTSVIKALNAQLVKEKKRPVEHSPVLVGIDMMPLEVQEDWMAKLQHNRIRETLVEAASTGAVSHIHGLHPIPGAAYGAEFGLTEAHSKQPGLAHLKSVPQYAY